MGLFDDLLVGGAGLAFVEHEHTKHQRQRFEQQYALEQQQMQYQNGPRGGYAQQQSYSQNNGGYQGPPMQYGSCCPNCGFMMGGGQQQAGYQPGNNGGYQYRGSPPPVPARSPGKQ